jgi:hypothetical protein
MVVGPDEAEFLLAANPDNRNLRPVKIAQFVKDMRHGRWTPNGESIIVSTEGELNDGQHRLAAILQSRIPQRLMVAFGYPRESRYSVDTGAARTAGDHLTMAGQGYSQAMAAAARLIISYEQNNGRTLGRRASITSLEVQERVKEDPLLQEVVRYCSNHRIPFARASTVAFVFYVLARIAPREAREYIDGVLTGLELSAHDPAYIARERLMRGNEKKLTDTQIVEILFRAWNYFASGHKGGKVQMMGALPVLKQPKFTSSPISTEVVDAIAKVDDTGESIVPYDIADRAGVMAA